MGMIQRFKDIMSANINALLDKAENPEKMIDQYLRNLEEDLGKVKAETASVMAEEKRAKRELEECNAEIAKMQKYAATAVAAGNEADAKQFLIRKKSLTEKQSILQQTYEAAASNSIKMRQMHDKLIQDITNLNNKRDAIKAKMAVAKAQKRVNEVGSSFNGVSDHLDAFSKMEAKANKMLDEAEAMAELNSTQQSSNLDDLMLKYDLQDAGSDVDDELAALKASMGLE